MLAAADKSDRQPVGNAKEHHGWREEPLVNFSCELGILTPSVVLGLQHNRKEKETVRPSLLKETCP